MHESIRRIRGQNIKHCIHVSHCVSVHVYRIFFFSLFLCLFVFLLYSFLLNIPNCLVILSSCLCHTIQHSTSFCSHNRYLFLQKYVFSILLFSSSNPVYTLFCLFLVNYFSLSIFFSFKILSIIFFHHTFLVFVTLPIGLFVTVSPYLSISIAQISTHVATYLSSNIYILSYLSSSLR